VLSNSQNILDDENAIDILTEAKNKSNLISEKQSVADQTEKTIDCIRMEYQDVSREASCLFFVICDLNYIDPMYQYSLSYYIDLFTQAIINS
jgi:dynein heavy chain